MKDSFIFYLSQYDAIKELSDEQLGMLFRAIFEKQLGNEVVLDNSIKIAFNFINNQMVVDKEKYLKKVETLRNNALKGGAPKGNQNAKKEKQPKQPNREKNNHNDNVNVNDNVYENEYVNGNVYVNDFIISYYCNNIHQITPLELEKLEIWRKDFSDEIIKAAISEAVMHNARTMAYIEGILRVWKQKGYKTLNDIKKIEKEGTNSEELFDYDWLNEEE